MSTEPEPTSTNTIHDPSATPTSLLSSLHAYPFTSDPAFLTGLSNIFGHPGRPVTEEELLQKPDLVLSAKCFYFSRKFQTPAPIDPAAYRAWLASQTPESATAVLPVLHSTTVTETSVPLGPPQEAAPEPSAKGESQPQPPPYPTSFAAIIDLITNNKPIPGIEEIPDTVLELGSSKQDKAVRRRKPWEKDTDDGNAVVTTEPAMSTNEVRTSPELDQTQSVSETLQSTSSDEGLLRLLRPDAVPDSGLVAKE